MRRFLCLAFAALALAALASACSASPGATGSSSAADTIDVKAALETNLFFLCTYGATVKDEPACSTDVVTGVCSQGKNSLSQATASLASGPSADKFLKTDEDRADMIQSIHDDFAADIDTCLNGRAKAVDDANAAVRNDPDIQARLEAGRDRFWHTEVRAIGRVLNRNLNPVFAGNIPGTVSEVADDGLKAMVKSGGARIVKNLTRQFLGGLCVTGSKLAADFVAAGADHDTKCDFSWDDKRAAACLRTVGDACATMMGFVDVSSWGLQSDDQVVSYIEDIASLGLEAICSAGGPPGRIACGLVNVTAQQAVKLWETGDTDWAECAGASQLGVCIGEWIGAGGWTNNSGVEMAHTETGADGNGYIVRGCCHCTEDHITVHKWSFSSDTVDSSENWVGVIQSGDYASGNCGVKEGATFVDDLDPSMWDSQRHEHRYHDCERAVVLGDRCSIHQNGGNNSLDRWDDGAHMPSDQFISP